MMDALQVFGLSINLCDNNLEFTGEVTQFYVTQVSSKARATRRLIPPEI